MEQVENDTQEMLITLTADIVTAHVSNNNVEVQDMPALIQHVYEALAGLGHDTMPEQLPEPAVSIRTSIKSDHIVCLEDGKKFKSLKRHLRTRYDMSPEEYREKWGLAADYPMVAPAYAKQRSELARKMGLGQAKK